MKKKKTISAKRNWETATLANNFIFYKVMRNHPEECKKLIEMLLRIKIKEMEMHSEETIDLDHDSKGIRLDIFVKEKKRMHDIELQVLDTKELPKRARYYAGLMALDTLQKGDKYSKLRDSHVIFICMKDIFKHKLPVYSFENICKEDNTIKLNDRDFKHFFIAPICAKMIEDAELKAFFELLISNNPSSSFTSQLKIYVNDAKHNMQWRQQYMTYLRQRTYDREKGRLEGARQKALETASKMITKNYPVSEIVEMTGLTDKQIKELKK